MMDSTDRDSPPKLRVGYLINQYPKPSHTFIRTEMQELERQGHEVARLAIRGWEDRAASRLDADEQAATEYVLKGGVLPLLREGLLQALRAPAGFARAMALTWRLGRGSQAGLVKHGAYLLEACWTARWARRQRITHLHAHFGTNTAAVAAIVHALSGLPFSFTVHGPDEFDSPRQLKLREKAQAAAFVVAITSYCRSQLFRWVEPRHWPKVKIVRCTPDPAFLDDDSPRTPATKRLICVGRLSEQKGQLTLIEAFGIAVSQGLDADLVLAGDGPMRAEIEEAIRAAGLEARVSITGWIDSDRVKAELQRADALVLPSFAEGLPVVIMEAMALGRPILSTLIAGIPELVRDGKDGFLVPAGDSRLFADAILRFFSLPHEERDQLASNCRDRVRQLHAPAREAAFLAELIASGGEASRG
jgi:glycosyltransferase involved in cell wall biosynthesis